MALLFSKDRAGPVSRTLGIDYRALLYWYLRVLGFVATSLLISWGLFLLFFIVIGGFSFDGMMHQLNNLASRYVAASAARTDSFRYSIAIAHVLVSAGVMVFRRHALLPTRASEGSKHHG